MYLPLDATRRSKNLSLTSVLSYTELYLSTSSWSLNLSKVSSVWIRFRNAAILSSLDNIIPQNVLAMRDQAEGATAIVQNVRERIEGMACRKDAPKNNRNVWSTG